MAGPWEKYAAPQPAAEGPWAKYGTQEPPEPTFGEKVAAIPGKIASAVQGNASEDLPDVYSPEFSTAIGGRGESGLQRTVTQLIPGANLVQLGMQLVDRMHPETQPAEQAQFARDVASGAGKDEDVAQRLLATVPGSTLSKDENGNPVLQLQDGKRFYVNKPGLDANDVSRVAQKAAAFIPAGKATGALGNVGARILGGATTAAATQGALDLTASAGKRLDTKDVALAALFGGGAEAAAPLIGAAWKGIKNAFAGDPVSAGKALAVKLNLGTNLGDDVYRGLAEHADEISAGMRPEAAVAESEFAIPLTRGQKTGDFSQLATEERIANESNRAGTLMRGMAEEQRDAVGAARGALGAELPESAAAGMQKLQGALRGEQEALKKATKDAYEAVDLSKTTIQKAATDGLPKRLRAALSDMNLDPAAVPGTATALKDVENEVAKFAGAREIKLSALENGRRRINNALGTAANPTDKSALRRLKAEYDNWMGEAMDSAIVQGDAATLDALKTARGLRAELAKRFESKDGAGKLVADAVRQGKSADGLADTLLGASQVSKGSGDEVAAAIKTALGKNQEGWDALRGTVLLRATTDKSGNVLGAAQMQKNLRQMLKERPELMKTLFPQELPKIRRFTEALSTMVKPEGLKRSSGTGERIWNYLSGVPGISWIMKPLQGPASFSQASSAMKPLGDDGVRLLGSPAAATQGSNQ